MGITAFIPAKMKSQRLPEKNMRALGGLPLIHYSIRAAELAHRVDNIVVSSESPKVLDYARGLGVSLHERPEELSEAKKTSIQVIHHWHLAQQEPPELVLLLQPTHPLRNPKDLDAAIDLFKSGDADCLFSLVEEDCLLGTLDNGHFRPEQSLPRDRSKSTLRYRNTGSFYLFRPEATFLSDRPFGQTIMGYVLDHPEFEIDIDHESDFRLAEVMLASHGHAFAHFHTP